MTADGSGLRDSSGNFYPLVNGAYRFVDQNNYTENFGFQWKNFRKTQLDKFSDSTQSKDRFFAVTGWQDTELNGESLLEVGSGAGRFTQIVLDHTEAELHSVDYSDAVEANYENNGPHERLHLYQANIYELPFKEGTFDKAICFGVLQHTPDVKKSISCLIEKIASGGELIVDFYAYKGWWTKFNAKYIFRRYTRKMSQEDLLTKIKNNIGWMITITRFFSNIGLNKVVNRFIPICNIADTFPKGLSKDEIREWAILDTFDMYSPEYDQPQKLHTVEKWFLELGMQEVQAKYINFGKSSIAVVKGIKP